MRGDAILLVGLFLDGFGHVANGAGVAFFAKLRKRHGDSRAGRELAIGKIACEDAQSGE